MTVAAKQWKKHYSTQSSKLLPLSPSCSGASSGVQINPWNHRPHYYIQYYEQWATPQVRQGFLVATSFMGIIGLGGVAEVRDFPTISLSLCVSSISTCSPSTMHHSQHHMLCDILATMLVKAASSARNITPKRYIYIYLYYIYVLY